MKLGVFKPFQSLVVLFRRWRTSRPRLQNMCVALCSMNCAILLLVANFGVEHPVIFKHLFHARPLSRINLEHAPNDMTTLTRKDTEKSPWSFDHFLLLATRGSRPTLVNALGMMVPVV
jgi:hypothetical protein